MTQQTRLRPNLTLQSLLFMVGSSLFAGGTAVAALGDDAGAHTANVLCFIGAWFFTTAGLVQVYLSLPVRVATPTRSAHVNPAWVAATTQSAGTILFNVSTTAALLATSVHSQREFVWSPDAGGSVLFLVSAAFVFVAYPVGRRAWDPRAVEWWSAFINMLGCIAFGVSAVGAFVLRGGDAASLAAANWGTFAGAVCFFLASLIVLPVWRRVS